ncbi:MAG: NAD(P)-dependent oxidoreductase [Planctomycetota bacterium]
MPGTVNVILGGAGLLGSALQRKLQAQGEESVVYDLKDDYDLRFQNPPAPDGDAYYWFLAWDVGGAKYITGPESQMRILTGNLRLMERVFGWLHERKARFTFVSTQMIGYPNAYGITKLVGEYWSSLAGDPLVARLWNCYDAEEPSKRSHVMPDLIEQGAKGAIKLLTTGVERRQFLHADDVADALIHQRQTAQPLADITTGQWVPILDVANEIAKHFNADVVPGEAEGYESLVEPKHWLEGWKPALDLEQGVERVVQRMRQHGWIPA